MSNDIAIHVENLGKRYRLGMTVDLKRDFRDTIKALPRMFRRSIAEKQNGEDYFWALRDINFEVKRGEAIGIIGRNGAGKSTLLKILSRITTPTEGRAEIHGRVGSLLEVGTGFNPELSGKENIYLNGSILGMTKREIDAKFDEIVDFAGTEKFLDTPLKRYSSGMRVRLGFSVAAHLEPEILIVDEVLSVGDTEFQKKCMGKMHNIATGGRTIFFVSHNLASIERLCERVMLLDQGNLITQGDPTAVIEEYRRNGEKRKSEIVWDDPKSAPGNDIARLKAVRAYDDKGQVRSEYKVNEDLYLELEFWSLSGDVRLDSGFYLYTDSGELLLSAMDLQNEKWRHKPRPQGLHKTRCLIPKNLLTEGGLSVSAFVVTAHKEMHLFERDVVELNIIDHFDEGSARGDYKHKWPHCAVRPLLQWEFEYNGKAI
ncbi:ABC transporter ATP-binding protein [Candidatus Sumerlaeota bacterium]|nr:ABC transporter ATP-binding protein [Candidatus Sumerlaeota bacterium]